MKARKIISLILAACMVMGIITPAFADESQVNDHEYYDKSDNTKYFDIGGLTPETKLNGNGFDIEENGAVKTVVSNHTVNNNMSKGMEDSTSNINVTTGVQGTSVTLEYGIMYNEGTVKNNGSTSYEGTICNNSGTVVTNTEKGTIITNWGLINDNKGTVNTNNFNHKIIKNEGTVSYNAGTILNNEGTVQDNKGYINENKGNNGKVETNRNYIFNNSATVESNNYYIEKNDVGGTVTDNTLFIRENSGAVTANSGGTIENNKGFVKNYGPSGSGTIINNYYDDQNKDTDKKIDNEKGTIVNNYGYFTDTGDNVGTITNNFGTVKYDGTVDQSSAQGKIKNNYGILINSYRSDMFFEEQQKTASTDPDTYLYGVTYARNDYNHVDMDNLNFNLSVTAIGDLTKNLDNSLIHEDTENGKTFHAWKNAFTGTEVSTDKAYQITNITDKLWMYATYDISSGKTIDKNIDTIVTNSGTITTNTSYGVVENNSGTIGKNSSYGTVNDNDGIVGLNYGTITFDGDKNGAVEDDKPTVYVEKNYGTLINAKKVNLDKDGKIIADNDTTTEVATTVYMDSGNTIGQATATLYAITYSRNAIFNNGLISTKDSYIEETDGNSIWKTETNTSDDFIDDEIGAYQISEFDENQFIGAEQYSGVCYEYWIDVLDNNRKYSKSELWELTTITRSMWLRPVFSGYIPSPEPGPGGGGGTSGGGNEENDTPAIPADVPTNTPMTAGDILNNPNLSSETKELLKEILDETSTGSIIIKEDGTIAVPGPGGIPVDVTIEDDKVTLGTMTKDDIKKAVDSLKNSDSGKTDDKTDDKKDGKTDTNGNSNPKTNKAISIDVSVFKGIGQVEVNSDTLNNIAESDAEGLKTTMSIGSMTLDKSAITGVSGILMGRNLILVVEEMDEGLLSKKQKKVVEESKEDENYLAVVDSYLLASNDKIKNLGNGKAILEIKLDALGYKEAAGKAPVVYEIAEDGTKTKIDYEIVDHIITFEVNELSTYLITVE